MQYEGSIPTLRELYIEAFEDGKEIPRVFNDREFNEMDSSDNGGTWQKSRDYTNKLFRRQ